MDLSSFDMTEMSNQGVKVPLRHPQTSAELTTADGKQVTVTVLGEQSDAYQKALRSTVNRRLAMQSKRRGGNIATLEEIEADEVQMLAVCIKGWENISLDGKTLEFTQDNVRKLLSDNRMKWVKEQLMEAIRDASLFMKN